MSNPLTELRSIAEHIDPQFHPTLNEVPALLAALIVRLAKGDELATVIADGQKAQRELHPLEVAGNEVRQAVADLIEPPPADSTRNGAAGQSAENTALRNELDSLRQQVEHLSTFVPREQPETSSPDEAQQSTGESTPAESSPAGAPSSDREAELQAEIEQLQHALAQRQALDAGTQGHPTAESTPEP